MSRVWFAWLLALLMGVSAPALACTTGGCVAAGPRIASVDSTRGALINALLGRLTDSTLTVSALDWNNVANGSVNLAKTLSLLQADLNVSTPVTALNTNTTLAKIVTAAAGAATQDGKTTLAASLNQLALALTPLSGQIKLGDLLTTDGGLGNTTINALQLVTGAVQLYNSKNVLTTPQTINIAGGDLGLLGLKLTNLSLAAQVVEPPVYVCGPTGTSFHTATIRIKLGMDLVSVNLSTGLLAAIPLVNTVSLSVNRLDLYLEVARADGAIGAVNAISNILGVQAKPGLADIYLGIIPDNVFFNRGRALQVSDVTPGTIASLTINGGGVAVKAKAVAKGQTPGASNLQFTGPYPQTLTAYTQTGFVSGLLTSLVNNLTLSVTPSLLGLEVVVLDTLKTVFQLQLVPTLLDLVSALVDPLLETLGVRLGEVDVTAGGTMNICSLGGCVYADTNHSASQDYGETGTLQTLYAKLIDPAKPAGPAVAYAVVSPSNGTFSFTGVQAGNWTVVINGDPSTAVVAPAAPTGWIGTQAPTLSQPVSMTGDTSGVRFGLYNGSKLSGTVFNDNGTGGGTANNGVKDGAEAPVVGGTVKALDGGSAAVLDTTTTGDTGTYTLWVPATSTSVKVTQAAAATWVSTGGSPGTSGGGYVLATDTTTFSHAVAGQIITGVNFADVPASRLETEGQQSAAPGGAVFYPHSFTAGTAGDLTVSTSTTTATPGWGQTVFRDSNCDGKLDAGETQVTTFIPVTADQRVCLLVKVAVPATASYGQKQTLDVSASLALSSHTLVLDHRRTDLTLVGQPSDTGLSLTKTVDRSAAKTGDTLVYTITYVNQGAKPLTGLKVNDMTPAYTVMGAASCGANPAGLTCTVATKPAAGAIGPVQWTFTGELPSGASGSVTFTVVVN